MRLVCFKKGAASAVGVLLDDRTAVDVRNLDPRLSYDMTAYLAPESPARRLLAEKLAGPVAVERLALADLTLLAPVPRGGKILCLGHNYQGHLGQGRTEIPEYPTLFCKPASTLSGCGAPVYLPRLSSQVDFEAELVVVMGRRGRTIPRNRAMDYVAGYTIGNDVSARDIQKRTTQWMLGKAFDGFAPIGPALVTPDDIPDLYLLEFFLTVNGQERQRSNTAQLIFRIDFLVAYLSAVMTLEPGDLIFTGTPAKLPGAGDGPAFLKEGDQVEIHFDGLGVLHNPVCKEPEWMDKEA